MNDEPKKPVPGLVYFDDGSYYNPRDDADSELVSNPPEEPVDMHAVPTHGQSPHPLARMVARDGLALVVYHTLPRRVLYRYRPTVDVNNYFVVQFDEYRTPVAIRMLTEVEALFHIGQALTTTRDKATVYPKDGEV